MLEKIRVYIIGNGNLKSVLVTVLVVLSGVMAAGFMWILALFVAKIFNY